MVRRAGLVSLAAVLMVAVLASGLRAAEAKKPADEDYYELYKLLVDTLDQVERSYVKDIDRRELFEAAIKGVLSELDPYSAYINRDEIDSFRTSVESEFGGIGIQVNVQDGMLTVISPLVGTPAYRAGLVAGDRIVEINGEDAKNITLEEAIRRLKGKAGTKVKLGVMHPGEKEKTEVEVTREVVHVDTVLGDRRKDDDSWDYMYDHDNGIAYVRITGFSRETPAELREALEKLTKEGLRGLVLDLRFNPGGLLSSAIQISDMFVAKGRIVSTEGRNVPKRTWDAHAEGTFTGFPMVVLVNHFSASASEIVAACLQDHKRAIVVGERTWGKGSVQNVIELEGGRSALKLTTASYHRPSGKNIHRFPDAKESDEWGVHPDKGWEVKLADKEMYELLRNRRDRDIVRPHDEPEAKVEKPAPGESEPGHAAGEHPDDQTQQTPAADRQLAKALEYLSGELARAKQPKPKPAATDG